MKRFFAAFLALALCCTTLFTACGSKEEAFLYYIDEMPVNLDPQLASTPEEIMVVSALFTPLFLEDANGDLQPAAAESYTLSANGLVYTITLKDGLFFNTDEGDAPVPVTAADYVFALKRVFMPETKSPYTATLSKIAGAQNALNTGNTGALGVRALSQNVLEITLAQRDDGFLHALTCPGAMPCNEEFFTNTHGSYGLSTGAILGNGSYTLTNWGAQSGVTLKLTAAQSESGLVNTIRLPITGKDDNTTAFARLKEGNADAATLLPGESAGGYTTWEFANTTWVIVFNPARTGLENEKIRQALAAVAAAVCDEDSPGTTFQRAGGLLPPSMLEANGMSASGIYENGSPVSLFRAGLGELALERLPALTFVYPEGSAFNLFAPALNQAWQKELSAFFNLGTAPLDEIESAVRSGNFDIALIPLAALSASLDSTMSEYFAAIGQSGGGTITGAGEMLENFYAAVNTSKTAAASKLEHLLISDGYVCPLYYENTVFAAATWVKGLVVSPFGPTLNLARITQ